MLELGIGADLLRGVGLLIWLVFGLALLAALIKPKEITGKVLWSLLVIALFIGPMIPRAYENYLFKQRYAKATALFDERCKTAGEKIYRSVEAVDGVFLLTLKKESNRSAQYELSEQAGDGAHGIGYIETFFMGKQNEFVLTDQNRLNAYRFVEVENEDKKTIKRYTDVRQSPINESLSKFPLAQLITSKRDAKYGILTEDISTVGDRQNWIAASRMKVINLASNEVLGERTGYMFDQALGNISGERTPWAFAAYNACPVFPKLHGQYPPQWGLTRNFVEKVLKPKQGK